MADSAPDEGAADESPIEERSREVIAKALPPEFQIVDVRGKPDAPSIEAVVRVPRDWLRRATGS